MTSGKDSRLWLALLLSCLISLFVTLYGLGSQPPSGDDYGVSLSAIQYVEGGHLGPTMWNHPPLRNILVYVSLKLFGPEALGVKIWSILFGILSVPLLTGVAYKLFGSVRIAFLAGLFLALDPVHMDFSRQGINDVYLIFFPLSALYLLLLYREKKKLWQMAVSGVMFGLGMASKWSVMFPMLAAVGFILLTVLRDIRVGRAEKKTEILFIFASLMIIPLIIYLFTFIPWFARGYDIGEWLELQGQMLLESRTQTGYGKLDLHVERDHKPYEWFIKPVSHETYILPPKDDPLDKEVRIQISFGNPAVWLLVLPSVGWLLATALRRKNLDYIFPAALFALSYFPLVAAARPIWVNTALTVLPYAFMSVSWAIHSLSAKFRYGNAILSAYLIVVLLVTVPLYLLATARGNDYPPLRPFVEKRIPAHEAKAGQRP